MTVYLHAGTHKTGSKSLQALLSDSRQALLGLGYDLYHGRHGTGTNHTELQLASMRPDRDSFARVNWPTLAVDDSYLRAVRDRVRKFLDGSTSPHQILTNEDLSYLRHPDEFDRLAELLDHTRREVRVVLVLRERSSFLRSYTAQILKRPGRVPSTDPASALYVGADSWLGDTEPLIAGFASCLRRPPTVVSYEDAMRADGSTIPRVVEAMGILRYSLPWRQYYLNTSDPPASRGGQSP